MHLYTNKFLHVNSKRMPAYTDVGVKYNLVVPHAVQLAKTVWTWII